MAVDDFLSRDTDSFVKPSPKSYYPTKIPIAHYQLRHFISSPEPDLIYYASGANVYCLNTVTRMQAHVTTLPWDARCTASAHGYVCVGGADEGNFAAIKVAGFPPTDPFDVDASLPLRLEHRLPRPPLLGAAHRIRFEKIGEDIVNSVSIHSFPAQSEGQDEVVAVLTNNDKTVRIYSLTQNLELTVLDLPFAMNHATISPDSGLLLAVGDAPTAYFFERVKTGTPSSIKSHERRLQTTPPEWQLLEQIALYRPANGGRADGYFSTAWSPSGRLCAVGSETGYITVFDVELLKRVEYGEDAAVQVISSTRPDTAAGAGAVRTMHFSPNPWDLLIWSEDQGRVCVADLRAGLKVKQVLKLDPCEPGIDKAEIADFDLSISPEMHELRREADFIRSYRRALDSDGTMVAVNAATEYLEADLDRLRLQRQLGVVESDNDPHGLTPHERQVIETLRTTRQRFESQERAVMPRSINYSTARRSQTARREPVHLATFVAEHRQWSSHVQRERTTPRRQASMVVSIDPATVNAPAHTRTNLTDLAPTRSPSVIPAHARRVTNEMMSSTDDAWRTIEEALTVQARTADAISRASASSNAGNADGISNSTSPELRSELRRLHQLTQMRERLRNARASQPSGETYDFSMGSVRGASRVTYDPSQGIRTAGLAMSQDGSTLYCGTEEGIFEFKLNLHGRRGFPAMQPR